MAGRGLRVGEYVLVERIGRGAFGEVWLARHHAWREQVAVKLPTDPGYVRNLQREGLAARALRHPNIVRAINFDAFAEPPYLVMEYVSGLNLRKLIEQGSLPIPDAVAVLRQVLNGLAHAHARGILHRDLKPENVLVHRRGIAEGLGLPGAVKVTDFGLGRIARGGGSIVLSGSLTRSAAAVGTQQYVAPEVLEGQEADARSDLYACGVVLYELLTGRRPAGTDLPSESNAAVPAALDDVFRRAYTRVERRFQTAEEFLSCLPPPAAGVGASAGTNGDASADASDALTDLAAQVAVTSPNCAGGIAPPPSAFRHRPWRAAVAAVALTIAGAIAMITYASRRQAPAVLSPKVGPPALATRPSQDDDPAARHDGVPHDRALQPQPQRASIFDARPQPVSPGEGGGQPVRDVVRASDTADPETVASETAASEVTDNESEVMTQPPSNALPSSGAAAGDLEIKRSSSSARSPPAISAEAALAPPPDAAAQHWAMQRVRDVYGQDMSKAKTADEKAALARRMLQVARDETEDLPARFALLNSAADLSAEAGDLNTAFLAINALFKTFAVDHFTPKLRAASTAARAVKTDEQRRRFATPLEEMIGWSAWADRYDEAREFGRLALRAARGDAALMKSVSARVKQAAELQSSHAAVAGAERSLLADPADATANLAVGRFRCLVKGDWYRGLPLLAVGSDPALRDAAALELKGASTAEEKVKVGDAWWDIAGRLSGLEQARAQHHATVWYRKSMPSLSGLESQKVATRVSTAAASTATLGPPLPPKQSPSAASAKTSASKGASPTAAPPAAIVTPPSSGSTAADSVVTGVQADEAVTWRTSRVVRLRGSYQVPEGRRLAVEAGAQVVCEAGSQLAVWGTLVVSGTPRLPTVFRGAVRTPGFWKGVRLERVQDTRLEGAWVTDAEAGVTTVKCSPSLKGCVIAGNRTCLSVGTYGSASSPTLEDCVVSFNDKDGVSISGSSPSFASCTITHNGGWVIAGEYYASPAIKNSIVALNRGGGLHCRVYECKVSVQGSVLADNGGVDVKNESSLRWDMRGNYWGPVMTKVLKANKGTVSAPNLLGSLWLEDFLEEMPKACGASVREVNGKKLW